MKNLHLAGTTLGLVACSLMLTLACGSSGTKRTHTNTGGTGNVGVGGGSAGISNVGGNGNTGGTPIVIPQACNGVAIPDGGLIADWECITSTADISWWQDISSIWPRGSYTYGDNTTGQTGMCTPTLMQGLTTDAHAGTGAIYVDLIKPPTNWGAGLGVWWGSATQQCVDASGFTGISFWSKGVSVNGTVTVSLGTFATTSIMNGDPAGSSPGQCLGSDGLGMDCSGYEAIVTLTPDWTQTTLTWSMFTHPAAKYPLDAPAALNPAELTSGPNFHVSSWEAEEHLNFYLDDVAFSGGAAVQAHTCAGGASNAGAGGTSAGGAPAAGGYPACDGVAGGG